VRRYDEAFAAYGQALKLAPNDAMTLRYRGHNYINVGKLETLRYRGHNYINVGKLDLALADLTKAESIKKDEFGIYYHLALAYYLTGRYGEAAEAYDGCVRTSKTDGDRVACWAWQYPSLVRSGRTADADAILTKVTPGMEVGENAPYLDRLLLFKGAKTEDQVAAGLRANALDLSTAAYGLGLWHLLNSRPREAMAYFQKATSSDAWQSFGYIAAATELKGMK
jgi:tetratricopeptide (TPR) repeat protein